MHHEGSASSEIVHIKHQVKPGKGALRGGRGGGVEQEVGHACGDVRIWWESATAEMVEEPNRRGGWMPLAAAATLEEEEPSSAKIQRVMLWHVNDNL